MDPSVAYWKLLSDEGQVSRAQAPFSTTGEILAREDAELPKTRHIHSRRASVGGNRETAVLRCVASVIPVWRSTVLTVALGSPDSVLEVKQVYVGQR